MNKFKLNCYWLLLLLVPPVITMAAEYVVNLNRLANADEIPFALVLLDKLYPVWGAALLGAMLGLFLSIFPAKELRYSQRLKRSVALGIIIFNIAFLSFYIYLIAVNGFREFKITSQPHLIFTSYLTSNTPMVITITRLFAFIFSLAIYRCKSEALM